VHHRPFFHAGDITVEVPAGKVDVACTGGLGRTSHLRDHAAVLDRARSFYQGVADSARR
jgi:hypothetical protein